MTVKLKVWRQKDAKTEGKFENYSLDGVSASMSFLEMMDLLNEDLTKKGIAPVEFQSDCREGICGTCSCFINGQAHGPERGAATCQVYMRKFAEGETIVIEPWRAAAFPIIRDLVIDRSPFDRIIAAGGYTGAKTGPHADANSILVPKPDADKAMDAAACIGCGACVAACPNSSASLFTSAKITHLAMLPQGHPLRERRVLRMVEQMDKEGFGHCTNIGECQSACPKEIKIDFIAQMRREYLAAVVNQRPESKSGGSG
ncbi:MAG: succinate dehydrogenase/fumarate reductase iron-sulfur subunit [Cryobacterium sp.]|nr:succinate dehydrogenase/fumarate reductase iron-sulfur subunit [Oligoflexia bacterium]